MKQLRVYAAIYCLEYTQRPTELNGIELRIYQNDDIMVEIPDVEEIYYIMAKIIEFDKLIEKTRIEEFGGL